MGSNYREREFSAFFMIGQVAGCRNSRSEIHRLQQLAMLAFSWYFPAPSKEYDAESCYPNAEELLEICQRA